jgi:hypothetical protein
MLAALWAAGVAYLQAQQQQEQAAADADDPLLRW